MEGWNDCPILSRESSSSSVSSIRSKKRAPRLYGLANNSDPSFRRVASLPAATTSSVNLVLESPVDLDAAKQKLITLLQSPELLESDRTFYEKRLLSVFDALETQHKQFVANIIVLVGKTEPQTLKDGILAYMTNNSGISIWCVPLKKLVDTIQLASS